MNAKIMKDLVDIREKLKKNMLSKGELRVLRS